VIPGHEEVLERLPGGLPADNAALAGRALGAFGFLHRAALERALPRLKGAARGRALWLLGRRAEAQKALSAGRGADSLAYLGALLLASEPARAERLLTRALTLMPALAAAWQWRAVARLETPGRSAAALADLDRRDALAAPGPLSLLLRAMACVQDRRWKAAEAAASALIALEPAAPGGWSFRGRARLGAGDRAGAEADYHEARDRDPDFDGFDAAGGAIARAERAESLRERGINRFDLALREYRALEPRFARRAWFQAYFARAEAPIAGLPASLRRLDRACRLFPAGGWLFAWRGETLRRLGRARKALRDLDRAVALQPWHGYAHAWRGAALQDLGLWAESARALDAGLAMGITYPADGRALHLRSLARARLRDWAGAADDRTAAFLLDEKHAWPSGAEGEDALRRARKLRPRHAWTAAWSARLLLASGDARGAERVLNAVLAREPRHAWARVWRADARLSLGRGASAEADLRAALRAAPGLCGAAERLAAGLLARDRPAPALRVLDRAAGGKPTSARFFALRADALRRLGRHAPAAEAARTAIALDGSFGGARALLAASLLELGRTREAAREAREAYRLCPEAFR